MPSLLPLCLPPRSLWSLLRLPQQQPASFEDEVARKSSCIFRRCSRALVPLFHRSPSRARSRAVPSRPRQRARAAAAAGLTGSSIHTHPAHPASILSQSPADPRSIRWDRSGASTAFPSGRRATSLAESARAGRQATQATQAGVAVGGEPARRARVPERRHCDVDDGARRGGARCARGRAQRTRGPPLRV